jgi:hypothetical protein
MTVKAWKGGSYGIRVGKPNPLKYFPLSWKTIKVIMDGRTHTFNLSKRFWTTCPEFRGKVVKQWLLASWATSWPTRNPPAFTLISVNGNLF